MGKKIVYGEQSRAALIKGANAVANVVKVTLGPKGKNVVIEKDYGVPQIINDGVSIAKEVELDDPIENAGARLVQEASIKANEEAGDGSTATCVLTQAMLQEGLKNLSVGCNAVEIKKGMQFAAKEVAELLDELAIPVKTSEDIIRVASVSAGNDNEVGLIIAEAMDKVGREGVITVGESKTFETTLEITEGMQFDRGYISQYFATDMEKGEAVYENPYVLCVNKKIGSLKEVMPLLTTIAQDGAPLLIIAEDIEGEALATLTLNNMRKILKVVAVKAPDYGVNRKEQLEDIAILTGGKCAIEELGQKLSDFTLADLGRADKIVVTKDHTTIIKNEVSEELKSRISILQAKIAVEENSFEKEKLKQRLARLAGGVAVIKVGAFNEVELKEKKLRIEDALNAAKAAVKEGIVAGGGVALLSCFRTATDSDVQSPNEDFVKGMFIVYNSLRAPILQIAENAGKNGEVIVSDILRGNNSNKNWGYDALSNTYTDMVKAGIIDPVKVTKSSLLNATSIAAMLLTTEAAIVKVVEEDKDLYKNIQGII